MLQALVEVLALGQQGVELGLAEHRAQRRLGDLVDRRFDVLDRDHRPDRILHPEVRDGRDVDTDVVLGDDPLRLDRHRDDS